MVEGIQIVDEAFSSADLSRLRKWVRQSFDKRGIKFDFSDHFMDRINERTDGLSVEDIYRTFAQLIMTNSLQSAFQYLGNKPNIKQDGRVIDFKLNGKSGSILILKKNKKHFVAETFYYDGLLNQAPRNDYEQRMMVNWKENPQDNKFTPAYNMGEIPKESASSIIRKSRQQNIPGTTSNIHGMDSQQSLVNRPSTSVFSVINSHTMILIDGLRKAIFDAQKGRADDQKIRRYADKIQSVSDLFSRNNLFPEDHNSQKSIAASLNQMNPTREPFNITGASYALKKIFDTAIKDIRHEWNYNRDILKVAAYSQKNPGILTGNEDADQILAVKKQNPQIETDRNSSVSSLVTQMDNDPSMIRNRAINNAKTKYSNILSVMTEISNNLEVTTKSVTGDELSADDRSQSSTVNLSTGKLKSSSERPNIIRRQRSQYNKDALPLLYAKKNEYLDGLLALPKSNNSSENDIRDLMIDAKNSPTDYATAIQMISDTLKGDTTGPTQFKTTVEKYLPTLNQIAAYRPISSIKENSMKTNPIAKYVDLLIADINDPATKNWDPDGADMDLSHAEFQQEFDPSLKIPKEYRREAKKQAFRIILDSVKKNPDLMEYVMDAHVLWIPLRIREKMEKILDELDQIHASMTSIADKEKKQKYGGILRQNDNKNVNEASKYLGPTTKVRINKKGVQTPLNKKGFGV